MADDERSDGITASLRRVGILGESEVADIRPLTGGVSNDVVAVRIGTTEVVVKRALARLRVADEWRASPERSFTEAAALEWARRVLPDHVPAVLAVDAVAHVLIENRAPADFVEWKSELLRRPPRPGTAAALGDALATWHVASAGAVDDLGAFADQAVFEQLRLGPFYERIAERHPAVADPVRAAADRLRASRRVLVHGDFSPKNVLVGSSGFWVIDWEVAHLGAPVFDLAFLVSHLLCKTIARPHLGSGLQLAASDFLDRYQASTRQELGEIDRGDLATQVACLLLARVDGTSPVEYFTAADRERARAVALAALAASGTLDRLWRMAR